MASYDIVFISLILNQLLRVDRMILHELTLPVYMTFTDHMQKVLRIGPFPVDDDDDDDLYGAVKQSCRYNGV